MAPPEQPVRIYMSAIGPQMCRLAGELADGVIGYCYSVPYLRDVVLPNLALGAERAGRTLDGFDVACGFPTIVTPDDAGSSRSKRPGDDVRDRDRVLEGVRAELRRRGVRRGRRSRSGSPRRDIAGALALATPEAVDAVTIAGSPDRRAPARSPSTRRPG